MAVADSTSESSAEDRDRVEEREDAAIVVLAGVPLGTHVGGLAQLGASVAVMVLLITIDRLRRRAPG